MSALVLEVCVDGLESALEAAEGGADRIELCSSLIVGGVTPSAGLVELTCRALRGRCGVYVLVRPRGGDFLYSQTELEVMRQDVLHAAACGAAGVVLGCLTPEGEIHVGQVTAFVELAAALGLGLTFHRAFDVVQSQREALEALIGAGVKRVLTSGGQHSVMEGLPQVAELVAQGGDRISVMPGGGVTEDNCATVAEVTGCRELHGTFKQPLPSGMAYRHAGVSFGGAGADPWARAAASGEGVRRAKAKLARHGGG